MAISACSASIALANSLPVSRGRNRRKTYRRHKRQVRPRARHRISFLEIVAWLTCAVIATTIVLHNIEWPGRNETPKRSRQLTMDEAREYNAAVPFAAGPLKPAKRYVFHGSPAAKLQATECLATAALYEAGRDRSGQRAVIQVVLNRVRHPGFPKTVCGVVYQGSSRRTGCQFTFTCDGSFERRRARAGWVEARKAAKRAVEGYVFAEVGTATHYHTDWVVPYWSGSLAKIAQVETHIFYR
jgi:spore germination cell wall hydrolase CwlJ-like protein